LAVEYSYLLTPEILWELVTNLMYLE